MKTIHDLGPSGQDGNSSKLPVSQAKVLESLAVLTTALSLSGKEDARPRADEGDGARAGLSHILVGDDGVVYVSLEDGDDRDLTGREVIHCLRLTPEEERLARAGIEDGATSAAADILGALPKRMRAAP